MMVGMALDLPGFQHIYSGKVRDLYAPLDGEGTPRRDQLLLVASDRISAFDYILDTVIPDKGAVLTQLSLWWFEQMESIVPNHVISTEVPEAVAGRAVLVRSLQMLPVECVARAYLTGGGLREYVASGSVSGVALPTGLVDGSKLPSPIFTPSSKAPDGEHDEPISYDDVVATVGADAAAAARDMTVRILERGNEIASDRGFSSPTPRSSSGSMQTVRWCLPMSCSRRTRLASGRRRHTSRVTRSSPMTRSSCASG